MSEFHSGSKTRQGFNLQYGLIGERLGHSFSKQIHERIADYEYSLLSFPPNELEHFIKHSDYSGINVTIPYKKAVIPFLDELSEEAARIGSVNTIVRRGGKLYGYNTDYYGFKRMAERAGVSFEGSKVLILGTGGTSLTAQTVASDMGAAEIVLVSRSGEVNYQNVYNHTDADVVVNTTPVGMYPDNGGQIIEPERFPQLRGVVDVVYNPLRTNLVLDSQGHEQWQSLRQELDQGHGQNQEVRQKQGFEQAQGFGQKPGQRHRIAASGGLPMLVYQAVAAVEIFTGKKTDDTVSERIIEDMRRELQSIVLIGMPGSGKTSVGQALSDRLSRELIDLDDCIVKKAGMSIPEIFKSRGESAFRELERDCTAEMSKHSGVVIATGGGVILNPANMRALMQNGRIFYLERSIDNLPTDGRPLSAGDNALERLYEQRHPLYMKYSDVCIDCNSSVEAAVIAIEESFVNRAY